MKKVSITLSFDDAKLDALQFSLKKENTTVQERMDEALRKLYEQTVPEPVREYLDSKTDPVVKSRRAKAEKNSVPKSQAKPEPAKSILNDVVAVEGAQK